jgi:hypothetical protein
MTAYNVVRFRVKPDRETAFVEAIRAEMQQGYPGLLSAALIKTGERGYVEVGEWDKFDSLVNARPAMLASLDAVREMLEDLGAGLGVTDAVSGEAVAEFRSDRH